MNCGRRTPRSFWLGVTSAAGLYACGGSGGPAGPTPSADLVASGTVTDRIAGGQTDGSTITFTGPVTRSGTVTNGTYRIDGFASGLYSVTIAGPQHVPHKTLGVGVYASAPSMFSFEVLAWGSERFGVAYDETFHRFFHQLARVRVSAPSAVGKWPLPPTELYLVEGTIPDEQFAVFESVLAEVNQESVSDLWCGMTGGPLPITIGPDVIGVRRDGIVVRPNWAEGSGGTLGAGVIEYGIVELNVFGPSANRLLTREELKGGLAHELSHVAGGWHVCGGNLGENPFGFSRFNCPFPDSLMANLGDLPTSPSAQDRLAACIIYHPGTLPGNTPPDTNPGYVPR